MTDKSPKKEAETVKNIQTHSYYRPSQDIDILGPFHVWAKLLYHILFGTDLTQIQ